MDAPYPQQFEPEVDASSLTAAQHVVDIVGRDFSARWKVCGGLAGLSALLFVVSLTQDALFAGANPDVYPGYLVLMIGWLSVFEFYPAWLANLALGFTLVLLPYRDARFAVTKSAFTAVVLALTTPWVEVAAGPGAPQMAPISGYGPGFWLWSASIIVAAIASLIGIHPGWERVSKDRAKEWRLASRGKA